MLNINFYCRDSKKNKLGKAPIECSIIVNGKRTYYQLPMRAEPKEFKKAIKGKGDTTIQKYCLGVTQKINELQADMLFQNIPLTAELLKSFLKNGCVKTAFTLNDLFSEYLAIVEKRLKNGEIKKITFNRYKQVTTEFLTANKLSSDLPAEQIDYSHFLRYQNYLNGIMQPSSSAGHLKKIKTIFKYAFECGRIKTYPATSLKIDRGEKDTIRYLTPAELAKIEKYDFKNEKLRRVADLFIFCSYTGLSYSDLKELTPEDFEFEGTSCFLQKKRVKTGVEFVTLLLPKSKLIAAKYSFQLPIISNTKYNEYLKDIQDLCNIRINLTTHVARHTYCAYLLNHRNPTIPKETIMRVFGWKSEKQLNHYAKLFKETIIEDLKGIEDAEKKKDGKTFHLVIAGNPLSKKKK